MIKSFQHKGMELFYETGSKKKINAAHAPKLGRILDRLNASKAPADMNLPGYKLHQLTGKDQGRWSISVSGNWRVVFAFMDEDAVDVDYLDYH